MAAWQTRPLDPVYPVVFIDAIRIKIRDGKVANRPVYTVVGVSLEGERDILGLWAGDGSEGAKQAIVQTCVLQLIRNTFCVASNADWDEIARDLRPVYTAATEQAARLALDEFQTKWGDRYPAIVRLWENAWAEFVPFLAYSPEIRKVICSTNAIESVHARFRRSVRARGHFPNEQAAMKLVPHDQKPRPHRPRPHPLDQPLEARPERVRSHLRRRINHRNLTPVTQLLRRAELGIDSQLEFKYSSGETEGDMGHALAVDASAGWQRQLQHSGGRGQK